MMTANEAIVNMLKAIQAYVDVLLKVAERQKENMDSAINWADLRCVGVEYCINENASESLLVRVEEASENCPKLISFLEDKLYKDMGLTINLDIETDW